MSLAFNSGGLITRGYGEDNKIITRGFASSFDFGGYRRIKKVLKDYELNILTPIIKENYQEINLYNPLEINREKQININSSIFKEVNFNLKLISKINPSKLLSILENI